MNGCRRWMQYGKGAQVVRAGCTSTPTANCLNGGGRGEGKTSRSLPVPRVDLALTLHLLRRPLLNYEAPGVSHRERCAD